jgi:hypothetical protein
MPTIQIVERQILRLEGFRAEFRESKPPYKKVNRNHSVMRPYPYVRKAPGNWSFNDWAKKRFFKIYSDSDFDVWGYDRHDICRQGHISLSKLRGT